MRLRGCRCRCRRRRHPARPVPRDRIPGRVWLAARKSLFPVLAHEDQEHAFQCCQTSGAVDCRRARECSVCDNHVRGMKVAMQPQRWASHAWAATASSADNVVTELPGVGTSARGTSFQQCLPAPKIRCHLSVHQSQSGSCASGPCTESVTVQGPDTEPHKIRAEWLLAGARGFSARPSRALT